MTRFIFTNNEGDYKIFLQFFSQGLIIEEENSP